MMRTLLFLGLAVVAVIGFTLSAPSRVQASTCVDGWGVIDLCTYHTTFKCYCEGGLPGYPECMTVVECPG